MQHVIGKLDAVVARCPTAVRNDGAHDLVDNGQHLVLVVSQLVHEARTPLGVLASVETVKLGRDTVQLFVGVVELSKE